MSEPPVVTIVLPSDRAAAELAAFLREQGLTAVSVDGTERVVAADPRASTATAARDAVEPHVSTWRARSGYETMIVTQVPLVRILSSCR